jgi:probable HAF family extracellular repeat protein
MVRSLDRLVAGKCGGDVIMNKVRFGKFRFICAFALIALPLNLHAQSLYYTVTILGSLGGNSTANSINDSGQIVGQAETSSTLPAYAVEWTGTTPTILGSSGENNSAESINATGQISGWELPGDDSSLAVKWTGTTPTILSSLGGTFSSAGAINSLGQIAGFSGTTGNQAGTPVVWNGTTPTALGTVVGTGTFTGAAVGINDSGKIVGNLGFGSKVFAAEWTGTTPTLLGSLGGNTSQAVAINNAGQIIGDSETTGGETEAVEWSGTVPFTLGSLGISSAAEGINNAGDVVGSFDTTTPTFQTRGFLYTSGTAYDLNSLILPGSNVLVTNAAGINDSGQIVGWGIVGDGDTVVGLLLTPTTIPEGSPSVMVLIAALGLIGSRFRIRGA